MGYAMCVLLPSREAFAIPRLDQYQGVQRFMRLDQALVHWNRRAEGLRMKWLDFSGGILDAISQEEMRICREELDQQLVTNNNREESRGS